jgi:hypothetical protein
MTLADTTPQIGYSYNGAGDYTFNFVINDEDDLQVVWTDGDGVDHTWVVNVDFSVTLDGTAPNTGKITTIETDTDGTLDIRRVVEYTQETDWVNNSALDVETLEDDFDKIVMMIQQLKVDVDNGVATSNWQGAWTTATSYALRDMIQGSNQNLYVCVVAHTSGTWSTDLAAGYWQLVLDVTTISGVSQATTSLQGKVELATTAETETGTDAERAVTPAAFDAAWDTKFAAEVITPDDYITGMSLSLDTDTDHDINITAGLCKDSANAAILQASSEMTKQIDATWAAGDDVGGMFTGSVGNNTIYHIFAIKKDSDGSVDYGFDTDPDCANIPTGYTEYRWIGWVLTDGSANILGFKVLGEGRNLEYWYSARLSVASGLTAITYATQALSSHIPTGTGKIKSVLVSGISSISDNTVMISDDGTNMKTKFAASDNDNSVGSINELYYVSGGGPIFTPVSGDNIYYKVNGNSYPVELFIRAAKFYR